MVKAKDFWNFVCEELNYRFFSGVACEGLQPLLKAMKPEFMHYVPAANERLALAMASGAKVGGFKGGILISGHFLSDLMTIINDLNLEYKIPVLIIAYVENNEELPLKIPKAKLNKQNSDGYKEVLLSSLKQSEKKNIPVLLAIEGGVIS